MLSKLEFEQQQDEGRLIWEASKSVASLPPLGRVLSAVFNAEWRSVEKALCSHDVRAQQGTDSLSTTSFSQRCCVMFLQRASDCSSSDISF